MQLEMLLATKRLQSRSETEKRPSLASLNTNIDKLPKLCGIMFCGLMRKKKWNFLAIISENVFGALRHQPVCTLLVLLPHELL